MYFDIAMTNLPRLLYRKNFTAKNINFTSRPSLWVLNSSLTGYSPFEANEGAYNTRSRSRSFSPVTDLRVYIYVYRALM